MCSIIKVFVLLAVMVCTSAAPRPEIQQCLCHRVRDTITRQSVKDLQIYPATIFCDKVEIVITFKNGLRQCLNPDAEQVQRLVSKLMKTRKSSTTAPAELNQTTNTN